MIGGKNILGTNNLRTVWGADAIDHLGQYKYIDPKTERPMECWVLERWMKPEFFGGKEQWEQHRWFYDDFHQKMVDLRGPYPTRGDYVMLHPLTVDGAFITADWDLMHAIKRRIHEDVRFFEMDDYTRAEETKKVHVARRIAKEYETEKSVRAQEDYTIANFEKLVRNQRRGYSVTPR